MKPSVILLGSVLVGGAFALAGVVGVAAFRPSPPTLTANPPAPPTQPAPPPATRPAPPPTATRPTSPPDTPAEPVSTEKPDPPMDPPVPLPAAPKLDAKNELTPLNKEKTLFVESVPDPADATKKKAVRVIVAAEVCLREGPLEVFLCKKNTKEHEAIVRTAVDARFIHAALIAAGGKPGSPVRFVDPKTGDADYKPASGTKTNVSVCYTRDGKTVTHAAQDWILDQKTKKPMAHQWVFAGSRFVKNPEKPDEPEHYCANNGEVVAISNFTDSMLDVPVEVGKADNDLSFAAIPAKIPPLLSGVWVIFEPQPEKK